MPETPVKSNLEPELFFILRETTVAESGKIDMRDS